MAEIEFLTGAPPLYTNHVAIERTRSGTYRFDGWSNVGGTVDRFLSRHYSGLEEAKLAAAQWASEHGVTRIFLPGA